MGWREIYDVVCDWVNATGVAIMSCPNPDRDSVVVVLAGPAGSLRVELRNTATAADVQEILYNASLAVSLAHPPVCRFTAMLAEAESQFLRGIRTAVDGCERAI